MAVVAQFKRQHDIFQRIQMRQQLERLKYETQLCFTQSGPTIFVERKNIHAIQLDRALGRHIKASKQAQQRRLARAGSTDNRERCTRLHGKIDVLKNSQFAGCICDTLA